ncbi:MAG TPA: demethylmenaquinone methyltransferase [Propionibacteriaceae bacterium]|nr:demethylmenaquinone methyltransferase [Propionibacteriaceae bacterium]
MQTNHRATLAKRRADVAGMFDHLASRYDLINDVASLGLDRSWRRAVLAAVDPKPGDVVLDLAAGTGTSSVPFAEAGARVVSVDMSLGMLAEGRRRNPDLSFVAGDALALPFADASFDAATISFGLRNVQDTAGALTELLRVVRPGGCLVICEFSAPTWEPWRRLYTTYLPVVVPGVAKLVSPNPAAYDYLVESIVSWPDQDALAALMLENGWSAVEHRNLVGGIVALHRGRRPL